jgi:hypothetical protein
MTTTGTVTTASPVVMPMTSTTSRPLMRMGLFNRIRYRS